MASRPFIDLFPVCPSLCLCFQSRCEEALVAPPCGPGVGKYDIGRSQQILLPKAADGGCVFRSTSLRPSFNDKGSGPIPEPGRYQLARALDFLANQGQSSRPYSSFISRARRDFLSTNNQVPW